MTMMRVLRVLPLLCLTACRSFLASSDPADLPAGQAETILASENQSIHRLGHINRDLSVVPKKHLAQAATYRPERLSVNYHGVDNGRMCFTAIVYPTAEETMDSVRHRLLQEKIILQPQVTLDQKQWPPETTPSTIDSIELTVPTESYRKGQFDAKMCGAAPTITAETKYLTAVWMPKAISRTPYIYIWMIDN